MNRVFCNPWKSMRFITAIADHGNEFFTCRNVNIPNEKPFVLSSAELEEFTPIDEWGLVLFVKELYNRPRTISFLSEEHISIVLSGRETLVYSWFGTDQMTKDDITKKIFDRYIVYEKETKCH